MDAFEVLLHEIDEKVESLSSWISAGQASDFSGYQKTCGEIRGLLFARQYITDLKQKLEHSNDE
jgi:hypothetical protein